MYDSKELNYKIRIKKNLFLVSFALILMATVAAAGADQANVPEGGKIPVFNCEEDFGIRNALAMLGSMCGKNIVPSPSVEGQLAFRSLRDVTFEEAMDAILGDNYVYREEGNLVKVYTKAEYQEMMADPGRRVYKVFTLYYMSATEAVKLITPVLSDTAIVQASSPVESVGTTGESITTGSGGGDNMALNDTIVILDYPEKIVEAEKLLKELDIRPKQVLIEATILSANLTEDMTMGIDWNLLNGVHITDFPGNLGSQRGTPIETWNLAGDPASATGLTVGFSSGSLEGIITALEEITDTTLLANPKILAVNKQLGQVYIGTKIGYTSQTTQNQTSTTQQVEFLDTGTKLSFRPYIGDDGYIRMDIHPKDSSGTLKANNIPDEASTELATNIMVKDGETVVIGGLFRDLVVTSRSQVPLLGDIPIAGVLFRGTTDTVTRQEVVVLLTPHIIKESADTDSEARIADIQRKKSGVKDELQWISRAKIAEEHYSKAVELYYKGDNIGAMKYLNYALHIRPAYLEAIRLKEIIISETNPEEMNKLERVMLEKIDDQEASKWSR